MKQRNKPGLRHGIAWLAGLILLALAPPALSAGKSPDDCKLENCEEWDDYIKDCVPIDPGPKPPGCYRLNSNCEWEVYTPDCKAYEDQVNRLIAIIAWLSFTQIPAQRQNVAEATVQCDCERGSVIACGLAGAYGPMPQNACDLLDQELQALDGWLYQLDLAIKEHDVAKKLLDDCINCRI